MTKNQNKKFKNLKFKISNLFRISDFEFRAYTQQGIAALVTILVISVAVLIMSHNSAMLGLGELDMGYVSQKGSEALSIAEGCADDTFRRLRLNSSYSGGSLTVGNGSCIINVVSNVNNRVVTVTASTTDNYYKKIEADIDLSVDTIPTITLNSWQEKDD